MNKQNTNFVHSHDFTALIPSLLIKFFNWNCVFVYDSHELAPDSSKEIFGNLFAIFTYFIELLSLPFVDKVISVSSHHGFILDKRYGKLIKELHIVYNYPSQSELLEVNYEDLEVVLNNQEISVNENTRIYLYASYMSMNRGFTELINSWNQFESKRNNDILILAGDGPYREKIQQQIKNIPNCHYVGYLSHDIYYALLSKTFMGFCLIDPYSNLNNLIGFPNKMTEYLATKTYVISTKLISFQQEFKDGKAYTINSISTDDILIALNETSDIEVQNRMINQLDYNYLWDQNNESLLLIYS